MMQGYLLHNLLLFGRILHNLGLDVNPARMIDVMQTFKWVEIGRKSDFYYTLRTLCVHKREHLPLFDHAFALFWQKPSDGSIDLNFSDLIEKRRTNDPIVTLPALAESAETPTDNDADDEDPPLPVIEVTRTYSAREHLYTKDFGDLTGDELQAVKQLIAQLIWQLGQRKTRRKQLGKGDILDMRRTMRRNLRHGGELLHWSHKQLKIKPRPLVLIADISGSMERYTRLLIHFLYSLAEGLEQRVEVFVFSTRLTRITRQLRNRNVDRAIHEVSQAVPDWSGGTRIGDALKKFNYDWARRVLRGGAITIIISDGWDRGEPELLDQEMARLQRTTHRLVWLNPLLGSDRYEPLTRGIVAALPHIDDFLPVHNLASLQDLATHLALLDTKKPHQQQLRGAAFVGGN